MRREVLELLKLGKLPTDKDGDTYWDEYFLILDSIEEPTTIEEAEALLQCFHDSEEEGAHGGAQTLMHIIESSGFRFKTRPDFRNAWHRYMWERQNR
ncbi:hypothetical protein [Roseinatronobacter alkalisoli]|uniref:Uncharacterized protein n=1 Tax=Roseinatronobacter alkalisoli TaxID=3028235 RepID=A0ABT5TIB6_9RHOB|nr:hypothetical protein [Roseinatronobacter sp. HJB301]MDD7973952.1 hypothetical protein [Roseinatronobacter sp. HJB301]